MVFNSVFMYVLYLASVSGQRLTNQKKKLLA